MRPVLVALVAGVLLTQAFIALTWSVDLGFWHVDAPVADGLALLLLAALPWTWSQRAPMAAPRAWVLFVAAAAVSALLVDPSQSHASVGAGLKWVLRRPVFLYAAYLVALPAALRSLDARVAERWVLVSLGVVGLLSLSTSVVRISSGFATWWTELAGLTPNHKTLAVWMAPFVPLLWLHRATHVGRVLLALVVVAVGLSFSKAAWITVVFGGCWSVLVAGRPLVARWRVVGTALVLVTALAMAAPTLLRSSTMLDSLRSRHSLDLRAAQMLAVEPILGTGPGTSLTVEMTEFPHYRINGVEAHGVLQKTAAETGLFGLGAWLGFSGLLLWSMRDRWQAAGSPVDGPVWAWLGVASALHLNLLHSTEAFTVTHWVPLGLAWAELHREER